MLTIFKSQRLCASAVLVLLFFNTVEAQDLPKGTIQITPENIYWVDAPAPLPEGLKTATMEGNPKLDAIFTMRVMLPPYFKLLAHTHPKEERVTVIEGAVYVGFGDKTDTIKATKFIAGSYYVNPADVSHYVFTGSEGCIIQVTGLGPWGLDYVEEVK